MRHSSHSHSGYSARAVRLLAPTKNFQGVFGLSITSQPSSKTAVWSILKSNASTCFLASIRFHIPISTKMSDYEDEMDVDRPAEVDNGITFSSENKRGKRSAANLPVEAQDSLPW